MRLNISLFSISLLFLFFSCSGSEDAENNESHEDKVTTTMPESDDEDLREDTGNTINPRTHGGEKSEDQIFIDNQLPEAISESAGILGCYVGDFGPNMINITLFEVANGIAQGYSVCAGNFRKIDGTYEKGENGIYEFIMEEPGDDQYDGKFEFTLNAKELSMEGEWTPFKSKGNSAKTYNLKKRVYKYDPNIGKYPEASKRELTDEDLSNLMEEELTEMRNEIYARHGYCFKNKDWRYHFEELDWYMPMSIDIRDKLSDTEVDNIQLIYEYESYFDEYYDVYGR